MSRWWCSSRGSDTGQTRVKPGSDTGQTRVRHAIHPEALTPCLKAREPRISSLERIRSTDAGSSGCLVIASVKLACWVAFSPLPKRLSVTVVSRNAGAELRPAVARKLLHGHSSGAFTSPARTGFSTTYRDFLLVHDLGLETALKDVSDPFVPEVPPASVHAVQMSNGDREVWLSRLEGHMVVVRHQTVVQAPNRIRLCDPAEQKDELSIVAFVEEDRHLRITTGHHMSDEIGSLDPKGSWHARPEFTNQAKRRIRNCLKSRSTRGSAVENSKSP
jgi:hypothetical protein